MGSRLLLLSMMLFALFHGSHASAAEDEAASSAESPIPPEFEEVQSTCLTPRQAYLQFLWWANRDPEKATHCFDLQGLTSTEVKNIAPRFIKHLNSNGLFIDTNGAPTSPNYVDSKSKEALYFDPLAPDFVIRRYPDGRWRFPPSSLKKLPNSQVSHDFQSRLPPWLNTQVLGIQLWSILGVFLLFILSLLVRKSVIFVLKNYIKKAVSRVNLKSLNAAIGKADGPVGGLCIAAVFSIGFPFLLFPLRAAHIVSIAVTFLWTFSLVWLAYRLIDVLSAWLLAKADQTKTKLDDQLIPLLRKTAKIFVSVVGGIFILQNLSVDVGSLLAGLGLGGLAFALAAKDTIANFFGSIMIFIDKPFQIGDWVVIKDVEGTVEEVGFRTTRIRTFYNSLITLPNSVIPSTAIDNYGMRTFRRYSTTLGINYDTPLEKINTFCEKLRALLAEMPGIRKDYYLVEFKEFGKSSLDILLYCFMVADNWNEELQIRTK